MSRQINTDKPLSEADLQYLLERDETVALERAAAANAGRQFDQGGGQPDEPKNLDDMTNSELQDELRELGKPVTGNKEELQLRLLEARQEAEDAGGGQGE